MAMRNPRMVVFTSAFCAMIVMTVLSAMLGHVVPTLIPKSITNFLAAALFLVFGIKMLLEARKMSPDEGVSEEMKEVEMELEEKEHQQRRLSRRRSSVSPYVLESGRGVRKSRSATTRLPSPPDSPSSSSSRDNSPSRQSFLSNALVGINNLLSLLLSPAWVQTFVMTFLGEWGDRSQIATIAMAAGQDYWWVIGGALGGHFICTGAAVLGGAAIAGKVSLRVGKSCGVGRYPLHPLTQYQLLWVAPSRFLCLDLYTFSKQFIDSAISVASSRCVCIQSICTIVSYWGMGAWCSACCHYRSPQDLEQCIAGRRKNLWVFVFVCTTINKSIFFNSGSVFEGACTIEKSQRWG